MDFTAQINKYRTELEKFSKKKLINTVIKLTIDFSNLQTQFNALKNGERHDLNNDSNDKTGKRIITTD